jgi:hypothetical protein
MGASMQNLTDNEHKLYLELIKAQKENNSLREEIKALETIIAKVLAKE